MPDAFVGFLILATGFLLFISVAIAFSDGSRAAAGCSLLFLILVTMLSTWFFTAARQPLEITGEGWWDIETTMTGQSITLRLPMGSYSQIVARSIEYIRSRRIMAFVFRLGLKLRLKAYAAKKNSRSLRSNRG
jgi:hypothetical protein